MYRKNCDGTKTLLNFLHRYRENNWVLSSVLKFDEVYSTGCCMMSVFEFIIGFDLFLTEKDRKLYSSQVAKSISNFENQKYSDVTLITKEKKFKVHKAILMERSPVFERMVS